MKNFDSRTKKIIIFGLLGIIVSIIIIVLVNIRTTSTYIIVDNHGYIYQNNTWTNISLTSQIFGKNKFHVYKGNEDRGVYEINYVNDQWYFFDDEYNSHKFDGDYLLAYYGNVDVIDVLYEQLNDNDISILNNMLKTKNINISDIYELTNSNKIVFDIDNDSKSETLYFINNLGQDVDVVFSALIYYDENGKSRILKYNESTSNEEDVEGYSFNNIIRINNSNKNYLILTVYKDLDINSNYNLIYSFNKNAVKLEKSYSKEMVNIKLTEKDYFGSSIIIIISLIAVSAIAVYSIAIRKRNNANGI